MNKCEDAQVGRVLQDDELELASGGFGFVEKGIIVDYKTPYDGSTGAFFLRNTNTA
jgi:hypothetical protein